jgi:hypothetical protein
MRSVTLWWSAAVVVRGCYRRRYRVWCFFEAGMVQLRDLPIVAAGHPPSAMQMCLLAWGSFLVTPPWWSDDQTPPAPATAATGLERLRAVGRALWMPFGSDMASVVALGKVNLVFCSAATDRAHTRS